MLNELRELSISLENAGINPPNFHHKFPLCPNNTAYWVFLDDDGNVSGASVIPNDQVRTIRKWDGVGSNGTSFSAMSVIPLLKVSDQEDSKKLAAMKRSGKIIQDEVVRIAGVAENLWADKLGKKSCAADEINKCLDKPVKDLMARLMDAPEEYSAITTLLKRAAKIDSNKLHKQLCEKFIMMINDGDAKQIDTLFFYGESMPTKKNGFQIIFEIQDWLQFPANHQNVQYWMNAKLLSSVKSKICSDNDAFGCNATGKDEKFPAVAFKNILNNVILRSMTDDAQCQYRYDMVEQHSFPAGNEVRKQMKRSLEWLGDPLNKNKTWCDLSNHMGGSGRSVLLFAYPSNLPQPDHLSELAGMMGELEDDSSILNEERFPLLAQKVTTALQGRIDETRDSEVRVFALSKRKGDTRTKVIANNRYSAEHVIRAAESWQEGCRNVPVIEIRCFGQKKGEGNFISNPLIPFPSQVIWCLNTAWKNVHDDKGEHCGRPIGTYGFNINDGLCLLLGAGEELKSLATKAISVLIQNSHAFLLQLGQASVKNRIYPIELKYSKQYSKQTLLLPSIIGLLLYKRGFTKGEIMGSPAFLIGRLLNLADSLHLEYCKHVRDNSVPPQLVGNAHMATALESPVRALSMLSQRILPYQAWGRTVKTEGTDIYAKLFLKLMGELTDQLKDVQIPQCATDVDKAQLLLGYLSRTKQD